jgi:NADH-quinone oxidoreductase subunit H
MAECESELIGGYHTEYGSMKMGFYLFAEYVNLFVSSAIIAALFFGGYNFPGMDNFSGNTLAIIGTLVFLFKILFFIFVFMWIRWTLPRFRYDQLMHLGWKKLIPISLINLVISALVIAFSYGWFSNKPANAVKSSDVEDVAVVSLAKPDNSFKTNFNN